MSLVYQKQFIALYELYFIRLVRFSQAYIGNREDAENLVQDVFLHLWEHMECLAEVKNTDAFLFTTIKNRCINFLKSSVRKVNDEQEMSRKLDIEALENFGASFDSFSEIDEAVAKAIDALPERCRDIFMLSKIKGIKYKEIALQIGISENTVENQISIALKKLREALKKFYSGNLLIFYAIYLGGFYL